MIFKNQYELSLAVNTPFILAITDLDDFKCINDTYGHIAGDEILKSYANIINNEIRNSDIVIRYGGEEFIIILPSTNSKIAHKKLNKLRESFQESEVVFRGEKIKTTVSIGFIEITPKILLCNESFKIEDFINLADENLYCAKQSGKNKVIHNIDII